MPSDRNSPRAGDHPTEDLELVLADYVDRLISGQSLSPEDIVSRHPEFGQELLDHLENFMEIGPESETPPPLGTLGDYTLRHRIGRGGMGVVYEAWQGSLDRRVALKVLPTGLAADTRATSRFLREAQVAAKLSHPQVVSVYGFGVEENSPYYAMEYVEGETLAQLLARIRDAEPDAETRFGPKDQGDYFVKLTRAFAGVADGLQHAHSRGVVHRDIKPSNLILDTEDHIRVLDFGLARLEGHESLTISGDVVGTPLYMSPEQARRRKVSIDHRTDVYSLGATIYEAITGQPPFRGRDNADTLSQIVERDPTDPRKLNPRVPRDLETIVLKCLRKDPGDRYGTAEALGQDLRRFVRGDPIEALRQSPWDRARRWIRYRRMPLTLVALVTALACSAVTLQLVRHRAERARQLATDEAAIADAVLTISSVELGLRARAGRRGSVVRLGEEHRIPFSPEDFQLLAPARSTDPIHGAVSTLENVASRQDAHRDAHFHLARAYWVLDRGEDARRAVETALAEDPDFVPARILNADIVGGELADTLHELNSKYADSNDWRTWWIRGFKSSEDEQWIDAARAYAELVARWRVNPPYIGFLSEIRLREGVALLEAKEYVGAQRAFIEAATHAPKSIEPELFLARAYSLNGDHKHASDRLETLFQARRSAAGQSEIALWAATIYSSLMDYQNAFEWIKRIDDEHVAERLRIVFLLRNGHTEQAIQVGRRTVEGGSRDPIAHYVYALALFEDLASRAEPEREARLTEVIRVLTEALELKDDFAAARKALAAAAGERKRIMEGIKITRLTVFAAAVALGGVAEAQNGVFVDVRPIQEVNSPFDEETAVISPEALELFITSDRPGGQFSGFDIWVATRDEPDGPFGTPQPLPVVNSAWDDFVSSISADSEILYFDSNRTGSGDLYMARRDGPLELFDDPIPLAELNTPDTEWFPSVTADGREIYFQRTPPGGSGNIFVATREDPNDPFGNAVPVTELNSPDVEEAPSISPDGLTLFFVSDRPGTLGGADIWVATRPRRLDENGERVPFDAPLRLGDPVNTQMLEGSAIVSRDWPASGSRLLFVRCPPNCCICDVYEATWQVEEPSVRFRRGDSNADGVVNLADGVATLGFLFGGNGALPCRDAADTDDSGTVDIADSVGTFNWLFAGGAEPATPGPVDCGDDPTADELECAEYDC